MFQLAGIEKDQFEKAVKKVDDITNRAIAEFVYFYVAPQISRKFSNRSKLCSVKTEDKDTIHYVTWPNGTIVDLMLDKHDLTKLKYEEGKEVRAANVPSKPAKKLAELMGMDDD